MQQNSQPVGSLQDRLVRRKKEHRVRCSSCNSIVFHFRGHIKRCLEVQKEADIHFINQIKTYQIPVENQKRLALWRYTFNSSYRVQIRRDRLCFEKQIGRVSVIERTQPRVQQVSTEHHYQIQPSSATPPLDLSIPKRNHSPNLQPNFHE